jgi:hypothetical protein
MIKSEFDDKLKLCLEHINIDFLPLHDLYRTIFGFDRLTPSEQEIPVVLDMVIALLSNNIICLEGPKMVPTDKCVSDLLTHIKSMWTMGKYDEINYGIWFDKKTLSDNETISS